MRLATLFLAVAMAAFAAEESHHGAAPDLTVSKWVHFGILAIGIGVLWVKFASPAIKERGAEIRKELDQAKKLKAESEARVAAIEKQLGNLSGEIEAFRTESKKMLASEAAKIRTESEQLLTRVKSQTENEIASLTKAASAEVKAEAARLALQLAEQKLAAGLPAETHASLVKNFVEDLKKVGA